MPLFVLVDDLYQILSSSCTHDSNRFTVEAMVSNIKQRMFSRIKKKVGDIVIVMPGHYNYIAIKNLNFSYRRTIDVSVNFPYFYH